MIHFLKTVGNFLMSRRRIWLPPLLFTIILFAILVIFFRDRGGPIFHYNLF
jgi:hypothetical protein